jgi:hypothetical protein
MLRINVITTVLDQWLTDGLLAVAVGQVLETGHSRSGER